MRINLLNIIFVFLLCVSLNNVVSSSKNVAGANQNGIKSLKNNNAKKLVFNIGSLLPDTFFENKSYMSNIMNNHDDDNNNNCRHEFTILNAINYATKKLSYLFEQFYGCYIQLNPADTHVSN
jgi:hypothetical protein